MKSIRQLSAFWSVMTVMLVLSIWVTAAEAQTVPTTGLIPSDVQVAQALAIQPKLAAARARLEAQQQEAIIRRLGSYETVVSLGLQHRRQRILPELVTSDRSIGVERSLRLWGKEAIDQAWASAIEARSQVEVDFVKLVLRQQLFEAWRGFLRELLIEESARRSAASSEALWQQAKARRRLGDLAQIDEQVAYAEKLQALADLTESESKKSAKIEQLKQRYPSLRYDITLPTEARHWLILLENMDQILKDLPSAQRQYISNSPLVRLGHLHAQELALQARRFDLDRRPDPSLGTFLALERAGAERVVGVHLSIPISGSQRDASAQLARHQLQEALSLNEETVLSLQSDLRARLSSWRQSLDAVRSRWDAYALQDEAATRSLRGFGLGERTVSEVLQARRVADAQYVQAITQSLELYVNMIGLEVDLGLRWATH